MIILSFFFVNGYLWKSYCNIKQQPNKVSSFNCVHLFASLKYKCLPVRCATDNHPFGFVLVMVCFSLVNHLLNNIINKHLFIFPTGIICITMVLFYISTILIQYNVYFKLYFSFFFYFKVVYLFLTLEVIII